jgi:hypothetical protein
MKTLLALVTLLVASCASLGPGTIGRDRFDYNQSVSSSWQEQTLLNIVRLRYCDTPTFLEVSQIVSGYTWEGQVSLTAIDADPGGSVTSSGRGTYTDRPTITYRPLTGAEFSKNILTPIKPEAILFLLQGGYPAREIFHLCVQSINGVANDYAGATGYRRADPRYPRMLELLQALQASGGLGIQIVREDASENGGRKATIVLVSAGSDPSPEVLAQAQELGRLLGLDEGANELTVVFGGGFEEGRRLSMRTRSMLQILRELSAYIDVPAQHVEQGRALPPFEGREGTSGDLGLRIHSGADRPAEAAVAVRYRDTWFWVDDRDARSKLVLGFALMLSSLAETDAAVTLPVLTIST